MGYLKSIGTAIIYIGLFSAIITFLPGLPPDVEFSEYSIKFPSETKLQFELKDRLKGAEVLFNGELKGPESFASYNGELYTGIHGGYVVKIDRNNIVPVVKFGQKCDGLWQEEKCGRPLGLQFNDKGELFVADAYYGIFKVNVNTQQYTNLVNISNPLNGKLPNALDIAKNGDIYWSDATPDFALYDGSYSFLANPAGRFLRYNAVTKKNEVLIKNLGFANGVTLADDESFVLVAETLTSRIIKYHLKGPKTGQHEIFVEALPGYPDNVHTDGQGGFLVSLIVYIDSEYPSLIQSLMPHPYLRKLLSRILYLIEAPFKLVQDVYPNYYAERVLHSVGSFNTLEPILDTKRISVVLRLDKTGTILDALYSDDGTLHGISSAYIHNGFLWLGSPWSDNIKRVPLKQAFPNLNENKKSAKVNQHIKEEPSLTVTSTPELKVNVKPSKAKRSAEETITKPTTTTTSTTPKPTTTTPKPTTTTPRPTTAAPKPTTATPKSTTATPKPTTTTPRPTTTAPKPATATSKPTSKPPPTQAPSKPVTQRTTATQQQSTTTPVPSSTQPPSKASVKEVKKETSKEVKKETSTSNIDTKTTVKTESKKKNNEATVKSKSEDFDIVKKNTRETHSEKSKPVEKNSSTKK